MNALEHVERVGDEGERADGIADNQLLVGQRRELK